MIQFPTFFFKLSKLDEAQKKKKRQQNYQRPQQERMTVMTKPVNKDVGYYIVQRWGVSSPSSISSP